MPKPTKTLTLEEKHQLYEESVQNPEGEVDILHQKFHELRGREPRTLREDFCGTGALMCEWVKKGANHIAQGIDLDPEPVEYGKKTHYARLTDEQKSRVHYLMGNVMSTKTQPADIIVAFNFSYFIFKKRQQLIEYFTQVKNSLAKDGVFFLDIFGGPESQTILEEQTKHENFSYYWDCVRFNPITNECLFAIHFKPKGFKKIKNVFTYDWRMWTIAELRDILDEVGFKSTAVLWEEDDEEDEGGNGEFYITEEAENCESWVCYIAAMN